MPAGTIVSKSNIRMLRAPRTPPHNFSISCKQKLELALHASLDINTLLHNFLDKVNELVALHGINYRFPKLQIYSQCGSRCGDAKDYELSRDNESLGELTLYHKYGFTADEVLKLEELLQLLVNPLFNALEYAHMLQGAMIDPLTQLPNRAAFELGLRREINLAKRHSLPFSLLMIDIDHFKAINDTYGHHAGDAYLTSFAKQLEMVCRESDSCFRLGGEEFVMLCPKTDVSGAVILADRIRKAISEFSIQYNQQCLKITISVGVAGYVSGEQGTVLVGKADQALYRAKHQGRNQVCS